MVLKKHEIEAALHAEHQEISAGRLKEDNPLDQSEGFNMLCEACRRGDLKVCQEKIQENVNINAKDKFDYTPLILASLCGHFEVVQILLESGALCERDTFQGERCLYNALNDKIRNLLQSYDYSKSRDPLQPLAGHITSLLSRDTPWTSDITLTTDAKSFHLHKFILSARSPYFAKRLAAAPETTSWKIPPSIPSRSLEVAISGLYFEDANIDFTTSEEDQAVLTGIDKLSRQLEIGNIFENILDTDRRLARQRRTEEVERGRNQFDEWFRRNVLDHQVSIDSDKVDSFQWDRQNNLFADVLLCAKDPQDESQQIEDPADSDTTSESASQINGIPVGPSARVEAPSGRKTSILFPAHRAMLLRAEYFSAMFSSQFREAQPTQYLPIVHLDCSPAVLSIILTYLYTEHANFGLELAVDVLFAADLLFIERLKVKAAMKISTLGNGAASVVESNNPRGVTDIEDIIDVYDVVRAGWDTRMHRLEEFGARYIAYRLERYIHEPEFKELVRESAARIQKRQETDTVELIDDIRYYLSERFRLRFEDVGMEDMLEDESQIAEATTASGYSDGEAPSSKRPDDHPTPELAAQQHSNELASETVVRTLNGDDADEFTQDAVQYQNLLREIDTLLEGLRLDA